MKKILLIATMAAFAAVSSYGQGFINYGGFLNGVKNNYTTPGTPVNTAGLDVELLFATNTVASTAVGTAIASSSSPASLSYTTAAAWTAILGDGNFAPVNGPSAAPTIIGVTTGNGGFAATTYSVANLLPSTQYHFYEVAWYTGASGNLTTLALAAAAGTFVGWSQMFNYTPTVSGVPPPTAMSSALVGNFDVGGAVPEPGTMALAALGGASLLLFRRKK